MKPFSGNLTQSNLRMTLLLVAIPFVALTVGIGWIVQDSPATAFKAYQRALSISDWDAALEISDSNTIEYLERLNEWIMADSREELYGLGAFDQFLVLRARFEAKKNPCESLDNTELCSIWMKALDVRSKLLKTKIMNQYYFGDIAIGQLFSSKTHSNTGLKFRLIHESGWKVDAIALMRAYYESSGCVGINEESVEIESPTHSYLSRHPSESPRMSNRHTL